MQTFDLIIVGAGPAGLSAAVQAAKRGLRCLVLEAADAIAGTIRGFTGGKWIMSEPSRLTKRSPLPFDAAHRETLLAEWEAVAAAHQLQLHCNEAVVNLEGEAPRYVITTSKGVHYQTRHVILAYGIQGHPTPLPAPGANLVDVQYRVPSAGWRGQRIAIVGAGDSALEDALLLAEHNNVLLLNRKDNFARAKPANRQRFDAAVAAGRVQYLANAQLLAVEPRGHATRLLVSHLGEKRRLVTDKLMARIGTQSPRKQLEQWGLQFDDASAQFPALDEHNQSSRAGIYVIGALAGEPLIKPGINQGYNVIEHLLGRPAEPLVFQSLNQRLAQLGSRESASSLAQWLAEHPLLKQLNRRQLLTLMEKIEVRRALSGQTILHKGQFSEALCILKKGQAQVTLKQPVYLETGDIFGEFSLLSRQPVSCDVVADANCEVIMIPRKVLEPLWAKDRRFWRQTALMYFRRYLTARLHYPLPSRLTKLLLLSAETVSLNRAEVQPLNDQIAFILSGQVSMSTGDHKLTLNPGQMVGPENRQIAQPLHGESVRTELLILPYGPLKDLLAPDTHLADLLHNRGASISKPLVQFFDAEQVTNANNLLVIDKDKCVGCDNCETACAATHSGISRVNRGQGGVIANAHLPGSCRHCQQAYCMQDCPADAITRAPDGSVQISDQCIGCGNCAQLCPFDAIKITSPDTRSWLDKINPFAAGTKAPAVAVKCDLCQSRASGPACVEACPTGAAQRMAPQDLIALVNLS